MKKSSVLLLAALLCVLFALSANAADNAEWYEVTAGGSPFLYSDSLLTDGGNQQDGDLAKISAAVSAAAYSEGTVRSVLDQMGFGTIVSDYAEFSFSDPHHAAYAIGQKKHGGFTIYCVAVRGTRTAYEWLSNAVTETENGYHRGYYLAESCLKTELDRMIAADGSSPDRRIFLLTGHSRGAAVSGILAGRLTDEGAGRVFCYTFACPAYYCGSAPARGNVYNFSFNADPVARALPKAWGYTCSGQQITGSLSGNGDVLTQAEMDDIMNALSAAAADPDARGLVSGLLNWGLAGGNEEHFDAFIGAVTENAEDYRAVLMAGMPEAEQLAEYETMLAYSEAHMDEMNGLTGDAWDAYRDAEERGAVFSLYDAFAGTRVTDARMLFDLLPRIDARYEAARAVDEAAGLITFFFDVQPGSLPVPDSAFIKAGNAHSVAKYLSWMNQTYYGYEGCKGKDLDGEAVRINVKTVSPGCFRNASGDFTADMSSVQAVGKNAFDGCGSLSAVTIGDQVKIIGDHAFRDCTGLTEITIPDSVIRVGNGALQGCTALKSISIPFVGADREAHGTEDAVFGWIFGISDSGDSEYQRYADGKGAYYEIAQEINCVSITDTKQIPYGAFYGCHIRNIDLCDTIESIGNYAFYYAYPRESMLETVTLPERLQSIGAYAFCNQAQLTAIVLPDALESIGEEAFAQCGLTDITIGSLESWLNCSCTGAGSRPNAGKNGVHLYLDGTELTEITIPEGVTAIAAYAFSNCRGIGSAVIGNDVTCIGECAFENCRDLSDVTIGKKVTSIGEYAFRNCTFIPAITIPDSVESIGNGALQGCAALKDITLPFVGANRDAQGAENAVFGWIFGISDSFIAEYQRYAEGKGNYYEIGQTIDRVKITDAKQLPYGAFYGCHIRNVVLCDTLKSIGDYAFYNCDLLTECSIAPSVISIGRNAFSPNTIIHCYRYTRADSWAQANGNETVYDGPENILTLPACVLRIEDGAFSGTAAGLVIIPEGATHIGAGAFSDCKDLIAVVVPDSVEDIAADAFDGCGAIVFVCSDGSYAYRYAQEYGICVYQ